MTTLSQSRRRDSLLASCDGPLQRRVVLDIITGYRPSLSDRARHDEMRLEPGSRLHCVCARLPTVRSGPTTANALIAAGGAGFLPYHMSPDALLGALRVLAAGERHLPADMVVRRGVPAGDTILTMREHDVLSGLRSGLSNKEIADNLSLSEVIVKHHIKSLRGKLGARNRVHAVCRANELDIR